MDQSSFNRDLFSYIQKSPTSFHAAASAAQLLAACGFSPLSEQEAWNLKMGGSYYVLRNQSSLFAFRMPQTGAGRPISFQLIASHSDSPCFRIKEHPEIAVEHHYTKLNVEKYGGALLSPWFDRPLSIAGRVFLKTKEGADVALVDMERDLAMIPSLAIHLNRTANEGTAYHVQSDLLPLIGSGKEEFSLRKLTAEQLQVDPEQILAMDLFLYNRMAGTLWGADQEFLSAPRLDNLTCAFSSIQALCQPCHPEVLSGAVIFDTEEVGSASRQGACSTFLRDCLERISLFLGYTREEHLRSVAGSFLLSADNGHASHPNYLSKADPTNHTYLNSGVLIKYAANQKYTSDSLTGGLFRLLCANNQIPFQIFHNHSDILGGSTLGNLSLSQAAIPTVDIGIPLLAMHSPYETAGAKDPISLHKAMRAFYCTHIHCLQDGCYRLE